ncbi:uncharacterized protein LOC135109604 isoform X3 [Scylla paramamosain]|uniref:uncharacterized protein LOC135109604 isoform X3 n=1 Tax=Scylla paramamosain TaxID=85552 RepID=UPI00308328F7
MSPVLPGSRTPFQPSAPQIKKWGKGDYWGLSADHDPDWLLTEKQKQLRNDLIELCRVKIRPQAIQCDKQYKYPRESLNALAKLGLLGLVVPKELGGLGESHKFAFIIVETLARYGCPSTALVYCMHVVACSVLLFRYHNNRKQKDLLSRLDKEKLVGTQAYSDPATGGHSHFQMSSKAKCLDEETVQLLKFASWATSAGQADWYVIQTVNPGFAGDYSDFSCFLVFKNEVRANTEDWSALGMHGNISGPIVIEGKFNIDRMIGSRGEGKRSNDETIIPYHLLFTSACWIGISLASIDVAKKHVTHKAHANVGMRVCDYPSVQDLFGEAVCDVNSVRCQGILLADAMDKETNNNDWRLHEDKAFVARGKYVHWLTQHKYSASKVVSEVTDKMLHACGGTGYKTHLGIERLLRDGKAGWVMGPSNEKVKQIIGKTVLGNFEVFDLWHQRPNTRIVHHEIEKMSYEDKKKLAEELMEEVELEKKKTELKHPFQDSDFDNPFNTCPPAVNDKVIKTADGENHYPALKPGTWVYLTLKSTVTLTDKMASFVFDLPKDTDHTGCFPGQYIAAKSIISGKEHVRYFSPVSPPDEFGVIEIVLRFESHGIMSQYFKALKPGDRMEFQGPCGGFEYTPNQLHELTLLASGAGITPGMQLVRSILKNSADKTNVKLLYFSENYNDILYKEELDKYREQDSRLQVVYTLGEAPEEWEGEEGFISSHMLDKHVAKPSMKKHKNEDRISRTFLLDETTLLISNLRNHC